MNVIIIVEYGVAYKMSKNYFKKWLRAKAKNENANIYDFKAKCLGSTVNITDMDKEKAIEELQYQLENP